MRNVYFLVFSGILFITSDFNNFYWELAFALIGGSGIGLALRRARKNGYEEGFRDGREY